MPAGPVDKRPGSGLVHPLPLLAIGVMVVNDHWAKAAFPGLLTGKVSDVAGLLFFPLLLQAAWELATRAAPSRRVLVAAALATAAVFVAVNTVPAVTAYYAAALGMLQWPALWVATGAARPVPVAAVCDPTDLVALPALLVAVRLGWARAEPLARRVGSVEAER